MESSPLLRLIYPIQEFYSSNYIHGSMEWYIEKPLVNLNSWATISLSILGSVIHFFTFFVQFNSSLFCVHWILISGNKIFLNEIKGFKNMKSKFYFKKKKNRLSSHCLLIWTPSLSSPKKRKSFQSQFRQTSYISVSENVLSSCSVACKFFKINFFLFTVWMNELRTRNVRVEVYKK